MTEVNLQDIVTHVKSAACSSCNTHDYRLPFPITADIEKYFSCFGSLKYPLDKVKIVKIENDFIQISTRIGLSSIKAKFKQDPNQRKIFEIQLAAYISKEMNIVVHVNDLL